MENYLMFNGEKIELSESLVEQLSKQIAEAREKKSPFDRAAKDRKYYIVNRRGVVIDETDDFSEMDDSYYDTGNYCTDELLMKKLACHDELHRLLRRFSYQNGGDTAWDGENYHYFINYNRGSFCTSQVVYSQNLETTYFPTQEVTERAIEEIIKPYIREHKEYFEGIEVE